ncbi:MAG: hypothetical protein ACLUEK_10360 [Oscillospiraceae bacterium]
MNERQFGLTPGRCLILCAIGAHRLRALPVFDLRAEATLALGWFPFTAPGPDRGRGRADAAGRLLPSRRCPPWASCCCSSGAARAEVCCSGLRGLLLMSCAENSAWRPHGGEAAVQPTEFWTVLLAWAGLRILRLL